MLAKTNAELVLCFLTVSCMSSASVTVQNGNLTYTKTGATTSFALPRIGTWTITATFNGLTQVRTVTLSGGQSQTVAFPTDIYLYNRGSYAEGYTHGWTAGEESNQVHIAMPNTALSRGWIDLTGVNQVQIEYKYNIGAAGNVGAGANFYLYLTDINGNDIRGLVWKEALIWNVNGGGTAVVSVSDINQPARFAMRLAGSGDPGSFGGNSYLYSVRVIK